MFKLDPAQLLVCWEVVGTLVPAGPCPSPSLPPAEGCQSFIPLLYGSFSHPEMLPPVTLTHYVIKCIWKRVYTDIHIFHFHMYSLGKALSEGADAAPLFYPYPIG